jgi:hypothetical protein
LGALAAAGFVAGVALLRAAARPSPARGTAFGPAGRARSVQAAAVALPAEAVAATKRPEGLERLASGYWDHVERAFRGLVSVAARPGERRVVLLFRRLVLLRLEGPEVTSTDRGGRVRWRVAGGALLAREGPPAATLDFEVERRPDGRAQVAVVLDGYPPALAVHGHPGLYLATQARVHEWVGRGWLKALARAEPPAGGAG